MNNLLVNETTCYTMRQQDVLEPWDTYRNGQISTMATLISVIRNSLLQCQKKWVGEVEFASKLVVTFLLIISTATVQNCPGQLPPSGAGETGILRMCGDAVTDISHCLPQPPDDSHATAKDGQQVSSKVVSRPFWEINALVLLPDSLYRKRVCMDGRKYVHVATAVLVERLVSLIPRLLPDFISRPWRKIGSFSWGVLPHTSHT